MIDDRLRRGRWFQRGVRRRGSHRKRVMGERQMQLLAANTARRWAAKRQLVPYVDGQRECDAPFRDLHGRGYWYSLEEYPIGSSIESRCAAAGASYALTPGEQAGRRGDRLICLRHTDPFRRPIWCRTALQARREVERHGNEIGGGPGAR